MAAVPPLPQSQGANLEAFDNFITCPLVGIRAQTQSAAAEVVIGAVALQSKWSGIFDVKAQMLFSSDTTAKTQRMRLVTTQFAAPAARFTGGVVGSPFAGNDVTAQLGFGAGNWSQLLNVDAAGVPANGVLFNGVSPNGAAAGALVQFDRTVASLTGLLTAQASGINEWVFDSAVQSSGVPKVPFTRFNIVVFAITLDSTAGGDVVTFPGGIITVTERPLG